MLILGIMTDHDRLFKELITTFFIEFLHLFLPDVAAFVEAGSIEFLDKEIFVDVTSGERLEPDLVAKVRFKGSGAFFVIHVENQSHPQKAFGRRLFRYFSRLHDKFDLPVYPIAILSFSSPRALQPDVYLVEFPNRVVLKFSYEVVQLNRLNWRDFMRTPSPVAAALMAKMQIAPKDRPRVKLECLRLLATLRLDKARLRLISGFVDTYLRLDKREQAEFDAEIDALKIKETEKVMEIVTSWMEEGIKRGKQEGLREGLQEGLQKGLQKGLRKGLRQVQQKERLAYRRGQKEGQAQIYQANVVEILTARFGRVPVAVQRTLKTIEDRRLLRSLLRKAATTPDLKDFDRQMKQK